MEPKDRRTTVLQSSTINGVDFVEVADLAQQTLRVNFLNGVGGPTGVHYSGAGSPPASVVVPLAATLDTPAVTITGGESIPEVLVNTIDDSNAWSTDDGHLVLTLTVAAPGDFSNYTLRIHQRKGLQSGSPLLDPILAGSVFSFKALCPSDLDCQAPAVVCRPTPSNAPPFDYLSKDFLSFRQALLDFSALRYPEWQERSEADFGVMFLEALSALADDLSYTQDRVAAEASLNNATQRRSLVRMARLVDYEPTATLAATVLLQFDVADWVREIPDGLGVTAPGPDGTPIPFETGTSLSNRMIDPSSGGLRAAPPTSVANLAWNRGAISPYWFDDSQRCLRAGATQMYVLGTGFKFFAGQPLLIETEASSVAAGAASPPQPQSVPQGALPAASANPPIRQIVRLLDGGTECCDPLYPPPTNLMYPPPALSCADFPHGTAVTLIRWGADDALITDRDLTATILAGNLVVGTQALTQPAENFYIPDPTAVPPAMTPAIVRTGPNDTPSNPSLQYLYTLRQAPLAWLQPAEVTQLSLPEIVLASTAAQADWTLWGFQRSLLEARPFDLAFTVDAARYAQIAGTASNSPHYDYDGDRGDTLRFGNGVFGALPEPATTYTVTYRSGGGLLGNVAADSITSIDPIAANKNGVIRVTNPMPASGGADPEPLETIKRLTPQAFRAVQFRAVLPADYVAAAQTLPWVERAGTVFRWTGSWLTVCTTPDPVASEQPTTDERVQLIELLNRYRMAGYESYVPDPVYVSVDLFVQVCALATAFRGDVEEALLTALGTAPLGFFAHQNFAFGQPLEKSALEAAIQGANGVAGVTCIRYRVRGQTLGFVPMGDSVAVGTDQIIRCDNDPNLQGNGSLQFVIEGGK